jgi:hypothetical protein
LIGGRTLPDFNICTLEFTFDQLRNIHVAQHPGNAARERSAICGVAAFR